MAKRNLIFDENIYLKTNSENRSILSDYILEMKSKRRSEKTIYQYSADIKMFFCWVYKNAEDKSVLKLKKRDFRRFFLELQDNGASSSRINRVQCSIRNMLEFCCQDEDEYDYPVNAMKGIKGLEKETVREIHFLTDGQINLIIEKLVEKEQYQKALYLSLSYDSAGRRNEVYQVLKTNFLDSKNTNEVIGKRGKKFRLMYLTRTRELASKYLELRGEDSIESLWTVGSGDDIREAKYETLYAWVLGFRKILEKETGEYLDFDPHSFRHSSLENYENGTHSGLKELGVDKLPLKVLKVLANHSDISTTESYLKNKDTEILNEVFGL